MGNHYYGNTKSGKQNHIYEGTIPGERESGKQKPLCGKRAFPYWTWDAEKQAKYDAQYDWHAGRTCPECEESRRFSVVKWNGA